MTQEKMSPPPELISDDTADTKAKLEELASQLQDESKSQSKPTVKSSSTNESSKKTSSMNNRSTSDKGPKMRSKTAIIALLIAIAGAGGVGGVHYLQTIEHKKLTEYFDNQLLALQQTNTQQLTQFSSSQNANIEQKINSAIKKISQTSEQRIAQLEQQINRLEQNQPSDWLLHEAEYLIRIASRTIWLEQDTTAAISLLHDADRRIQELNNPQYLKVRQSIKDDLAALELMPTLNTENVILSLMALQKQIPMLRIAMATVPESAQPEQNLELTENTADWRSNLAKTWQKFLTDFITVRRRTGNVEPLMAPKYQQNLQQNLALKLQLAQWAASEQNSKLYQQTLSNIEQWLVDYYDLGQLTTAKFYQQLQSLKTTTISFDYPNKLTSLKTIRETINSKNITTTPKKKITPEATPVATDTVDKQPAEANNSTSGKSVTNNGASELREDA